MKKQMIENGEVKINPYIELCKLIKEIFGHKVTPKELAVFIQTKPLSK